MWVQTIGDFYGSWFTWHVHGVESLVPYIINNINIYTNIKKTQSWQIQIPLVLGWPPSNYLDLSNVIPS